MHGLKEMEGVVSLPEGYQDLLPIGSELQLT